MPECLGVLEAFGLHLPPDTTLDNLAERICIAGHGKRKGKGDEDVEEEDEGALDEEGATYTGNDMTQEEQRPVMMSLTTVKDPTARLLLAEKQDRHKTRQLKRIERLVKRGLQPEKAAKLRDKVGGYTLSLNPADGSVHEQEVDFLLSSLEDMLPGKHPALGMRGATAESRPDQGAYEQESEEEIQKRARAVSLQR